MPQWVYGLLLIPAWWKSAPETIIEKINQNNPLEETSLLIKKGLQGTIEAEVLVYPIGQWASNPKRGATCVR